MTEFYRLLFGNLHTETFDDYRDVENAMSFFQSRGIEFSVQRADNKEFDNWKRIPRPYDYRAPGRVYRAAESRTNYDCAHCGLVGGH